MQLSTKASDIPWEYNIENHSIKWNERGKVVSVIVSGKAFLLPSCIVTVLTSQEVRWKCGTT